MGQPIPKDRELLTTRGVVVGVETYVETVDGLGITCPADSLKWAQK